MDAEYLSERGSWRSSATSTSTQRLAAEDGRSDKPPRGLGTQRTLPSPDFYLTPPPQRSQASWWPFTPQEMQDMHC